MTVLEIIRLDELPDTISALADLARADDFLAFDRLVLDFENGSNAFDRPGEALFGAFFSGQLIGVGGLNIDPYEPGPGLGRVRRMFIDPAHRGRGIGRALIGAIEAHAAQHFVQLQLFTDSVDATRFYETLGYRPIAGRDKISHVKQIGSAGDVRRDTGAGAGPAAGGSAESWVMIL